MTPTQQRHWLALSQAPKIGVAHFYKLVETKIAVEEFFSERCCAENK